MVHTPDADDFTNGLLPPPSLHTRYGINAVDTKHWAVRAVVGQRLFELLAFFTLEFGLNHALLRPSQQQLPMLISIPSINIWSHCSKIWQL